MNYLYVICGIFIDLQKALDTIEYNMLLYKLTHYVIIDLANCCFSSCLFNRKPYVIIN